MDKRLRFTRFVWMVLALALIIRVAVILIYYVDTLPFGGDGNYYLQTANNIQRLGIYSNRLVKSIGPGYPLFLAPFYAIIPDANPLAQIVATRLSQALIDTITVAMVYLITRHIFDEQVGHVALVAQALDMRHIFLTGSIATELLFIAIISISFYVYLRAVDHDGWGWYRGVGLGFGAAILIRPVALLFPFGLLLHTILSKPKRRYWGGMVWLNAIVVLTIIPWMVRTSLVSGEFIPGANSVFSHFWLSTQEDGRNLNGSAWYQAKMEEFQSEENSTLNPTVNSSEYVESGVQAVMYAPRLWATRIINDTLSAYMQPHGTTLLLPSSERSTRTLVRQILNGEASVFELFNVAGFWRKSLMYVWHFWGLLFGSLGILLSLRTHWRRWFPLILWIVYITGVAAPLLIDSRYIFPVAFCWTIFASYSTWRIWEWARTKIGTPSAAVEVSAH